MAGEPLTPNNSFELTPLTRRLWRALWLAPVVILAIFTGFYTQAASQNYASLFWMVAPLAAIQILVGGLYIARVRGRSRWIAAIFCGLTAFSIMELAARAWT